MTKQTSTLTKNQERKFQSMTTKSGKIRYLYSIGWTERAAIARKVGVIYQFVRGVLNATATVKNPVDKI